MRVLVTGATGFTGGHTLAALQRSGHEAVAFVRSADKLAHLVDTHGFEPVEHMVGDITDRPSVDAAVEGCDAVIHTAATVSFDPNDAAAMAATNNVGVWAVLNAAVAAGCDPVVHVSSTSALFPPRGNVMRADDPIPEPKTDYARSKAQCEQHARDLQEQGHPVVIFYPGGIAGPVDAGSHVLGDAWREALRPGWVPVITAGGTSYIDARDLADAFVAALEPDRGPRRYMAGGTFVNWHQNADVLDEATGKTWKRRTIPSRVMETTGWIGDRIARLRSDWTPPIGYEAAMTMTRSVPTDDSPLHAELGIDYRPLDETMGDMIAWLVAQGRWAPEDAPRWSDQ
ncbi:MAG: NAD-dependent epimerase/dehydratase family protein [Acidimicrobiia bacterium]|nr:NAD-dependent epimerase/dehydratase family protein [Acidimicrobiia bacterium]